MDVRATTRMRAVLNIYREHRKPRGGILDLAALERDWKRTGLRRGDLEEGLHDLVQRDLLHPRTQAGVRLYELTYLGERTMSNLLGGIQASAIRDWLVLMRAKQRTRQPRSAVAAARRRRDDSPPTTAESDSGALPHH